jgi:arylsulfatase A-like enzyme
VTPSRAPEKTAPSRATRLMTAPSAAFVGWLAVALDNAVTVLRLPMSRRGSWSARGLHLVVDLGHTLAVGLAVWGLVWLFQRLAPKRRFLPYAAGALGSIAFFQLFLPSDLEGAVERWTGEPGHDGLVRLGVAFLALTVPLAMIGGNIVARPRYRWLGVFAGCLVIVANDFLLVGGYPGAHVWMAATGATLVGASLVGVSLDARVFGALTPRRLLVARVVLAVLALASVVIPPPGKVWMELLGRDTALLARALSGLRGLGKTKTVEIPPELKPWFEPRTKRPPVPPSKRRLLPAKPIVIVITVDALRADVLTRKNKASAPTLHEIARRGVSFKQARSFGSETRYALASLFSGRYKSMLDWTTTSKSRPTLDNDRLPRLPEILQKAGVMTVGGHVHRPMFNPEKGILRGFTKLKVTKDTEQGVGTPELVDFVVKELDKNKDGPVFVYLHLLDPHAPYLTHGEPKTSLRKSYWLEVKFVDTQIGRLRKAVRELGIADRTMLVVSSDHGEAFGENGLYRHNKPLYDIMLRVPLLFEFPKAKRRTIEEYVSLMDIAPTVLDVFGLPTPGYWMSETLVPQLAGEPGPASRPIFMERPNEQGILFADGFKVLLRQMPVSEEVYDLNRDPGEEENLRDKPGIGDERVALARAYIRAHARAGGTAK